MYSIRFQFFDENPLQITVEDEHLQSFLDSIGQNKVWKHPDNTSGMWLNAEEVRFFHYKLMTPAAPADEIANT